MVRVGIEEERRIQKQPQVEAPPPSTIPTADRVGPTVLARTQEQAEQKTTQIFTSQVVSEELKAKQQFEKALAIEEAKGRESFETQLMEAEMTAKGYVKSSSGKWIGLFAGDDDVVSESQLKEWRTEQQQTLESTISTWKAEARETFETQIGQWRTEQFKGFQKSLLEQRLAQQSLEERLFQSIQTTTTPEAPKEYSRTYRAHKYTLTPKERETMIARQPTIMKEVTKSIQEKGVTMTLMTGIETLVEHPEVVVANVLGLKGEQREKYLQTVEPLVRIGETPAIKSVKEFGYVPSGFVATFERYIRPDIPTPTTALLQPIFEGGRVTEAQYLAEHPGYALGGLLGEWAQAKYVWGPIAEKVTEPIRKVGAKIYEVGHEKIGLRLPDWAQKLLWPREYTQRKVLETFKEGLYPAYGVSPTGVVEPLTLAEKMALAEKVPTYTLEKTMRLTMKEGKLVPEFFVTGVTPTGAKTVWTYRAATEFIESITKPLATRYFIPKYTSVAFQVTRGIPTTPMAVTLQRATEAALFEKVAMGGLSAGYELAVKELTKEPFVALVTYADPFARAVAKGFPTLFAGLVSKTLFIAATKPIVPKTIQASVTKLEQISIPKIKPTEVAKPIQIVKPQVTPISTVKQVPEIFQQPIVKVEPVSVQASVSTQVQQAAQVQQQIQKQLQQQVQIQKTALRQPTFLKAKAVPKFFELPTRRPRKRRGKPVGLVGRYKRAYPVASAKEMLRMVIGE